MLLYLYALYSIAQIAISPTSNSSSSVPGHKEPPRKASPRKSLHHRKRIEMESDGSTEETDSSENWAWTEADLPMAHGLPLTHLYFHWRTKLVINPVTTIVSVLQLCTLGLLL